MSQLTQPILNPIAAFDARVEHMITFSVIGGSQVLGNRLVISNNQTGAIVYDRIQPTMRLEHRIPANTLVNGGYYNAVIYTIDNANEQSTPSLAIPFYCFSQPTLTIENIPTSGIVENSSYVFQGNYNQAEGESLNSYQFILYDNNREIISQTDLIYFASNNSLIYNVSGLSNNTSYFVRLVGQTVNNTPISSSYYPFTVRYIQPSSFAVCDLVNDCENGSIQISSNISVIDGISNPEPPIYIDDKEVDVRGEGHYVKWADGFDIKNDFTMRAWGRDFNEYEPIITMKNELDTEESPNKIEMKWMLGETVIELPDIKSETGTNINVKNNTSSSLNVTRIKGRTIQYYTSRQYKKLYISSEDNKFILTQFGKYVVTEYVSENYDIITEDGDGILAEDDRVLITENIDIYSGSDIITEDENNVFTEDDKQVITETLELKPSFGYPSTLYSLGDIKNLINVPNFNITYRGEYYSETNTGYILKPNYVYTLSFDFNINSATTDMYYSIGYGTNEYSTDIISNNLYSNQISGRNYVSFVVPSDIVGGSTLWVKFAQNIILANVNIDIKNVMLEYGKETTNYSSPSQYEIYLESNSGNLYNYNKPIYIIPENVSYEFVNKGYKVTSLGSSNYSSLRIGIKNILQTGENYYLNYEGTEGLLGVKLYATDKFEKDIISEILISDNVFAAPENIYDIQIEFIIDSNLTTSVDITNISIMKGVYELPYKDYESNIVTLPINKPLKGNGYYDDMISQESPNIFNAETFIGNVTENETYYFGQKGNILYTLNFLNEENNIILNTEIQKGTFITPRNCSKVQITGYTSLELINNEVSVSYGNMQIPYYPHYEEAKLYRYNDEVVLTGNDNWILSDQNENYIGFMLNFNAKSDGMLACDKLRTYSYSSLYGSNQFGISLRENNLGFYVRIPKNIIEVADLEHFKSFLNQNNLIVDYTKLSVSVEDYDVNMLNALNGYIPETNIYTNNASLGTLDVKYQIGSSEKFSKAAYILLKCWNQNEMPYVIHSNYIAMPESTDNIFIWCRRENNIFDLKIENLSNSLGEGL